ncbi:MAG TPA: chitobiase/beta-hexosaminidase C-terminal domain-containing protein [Candidatus Acidoferrum sp.]|jgi:uncharacterized repeat protein (TIGR03806 family)|nr:chitobiase/beta-hexosaminidase C-terminal domain-containing protein [Candidatus Acidoferrum sp.]
MKPLMLFFLVVLAGYARQNAAVGTGEIAPAKTAAAPAPLGAAATASLRAEQIRTDCIKGRRLICGRVLRMFPDGLVVESGCSDLLRPPLTESWVVPGTATTSRDPAVLELNEPGTACIGLVFLTDIPQRPKVNNHDYVVIIGYPAGQYVYSPAPNVGKTIRKYCAGLDTAVRSTCQTEADSSKTNFPVIRHVLLMPDREDGAIPRLLSQTGAFESTGDLAPCEGLVPYDINVPFWSDGAAKTRWMCLPNNVSSHNRKIGFHPEGEWTFPNGTVFVKHFELPIDETRPEAKRRLETRLLVCNATGSVYGVTYKWRPDNSDAELLSSNLAETILIKTATGTRTQTWYYPSRQDCRICHTDKAGGVLGVKTRQINRPVALANGTVENQLLSWNRRGLFEPGFREEELPRYARLAPADDLTRSLEERARSYLDANCAHCHRPGGTVAYFDARYDTPLARQNLISGTVLIDQGVDRARVIAPNDIWRSIAFMRVNTVEAMKMPPLAHETLDQRGVTLLRQWIESLSGRGVLAPPTFSPPSGNYSGPLEVTLKHPEPGVTLRYTLDGSVPTTSDPLYEGPIKLIEPTTVRAKAFRQGFTSSITAQATFIMGD